MTEVVDILASNYVTKGLKVILLINRGGMQIDGGFTDTDCSRQPRVHVQYNPMHLLDLAIVSSPSIALLHSFH